MKKITNIIQINDLYRQSKSCDEALFAEMRTNVRLRNSDHYSKTTNKLLDNFRSKGVVTNDQKIRITKNHIFRITDEHINAIITRNPDTVARAFNADTLSDVKDAELSNSVLNWVKKENDWVSKRHDLIHEYVVVGESYAVLRWDYDKGDQIGTNEDGSPEFNGRPVIEKRFGFDCKRDPAARTFEESRYVFFDKVVDKDDAKIIVQKFAPDHIEALTEAQNGDVMTVFDCNSGSYSRENAKVLFREMFIRPCPQYPKGRFILSTKDFIVLSMPLPLGMWNVYQLGFSKITTTPRFSSIIRVARPYQIEVNRASSKMAEHQITIGDDKVILQNGSKMTNGGKMSGIRVFKVDGAAPTVMAGRTGEQYLNYVINETKGMYEATNTGYLLQDKKENGDQFSLLYKAMSQKAVFAIYVSQYEEFEKKVFKDAIKLCKHYLNESHLIKIVGNKEAVNIAEFQDTSDDGYDIVTEATSGDLETKFGNMITMQQVLQYTGSTMSPDQIGQVIKQMPYGNKDEVFNSLTMNYDTASNIILALDRGEMPQVPPYGDTDYYLRAITGRTVKSDFNMLSPQIKQGYMQVIQQLEQVKTKQAQQAQQAEQGNIPSGGFLTTVNASWKNPSTGKVERIKVPSEAVGWLVKSLSTQGFFAQQMASLPPQVQADIGNQIAASQGSNNNQAGSQAQGVQ